MLVTLVAAEKNCIQELFKAIKTVRIYMFIWQRVPHCRASVIDEKPDSCTCKVDNEEQWDDSGYQIVDEDGEVQHQRLGWGYLQGTEAPGHADTGTPSHRAGIQSSQWHSAGGAAHVILSLIHDHIYHSHWQLKPLHSSPFAVEWSLCYDSIKHLNANSSGSAHGISVLAQQIECETVWKYWIWS